MLLEDVVRLQLAAFLAVRDVWGDVFAEALRSLGPSRRGVDRSASLSSDLDRLVQRYLVAANVGGKAKRSGGKPETTGTRRRIARHKP
jgi:hypothetical protein